MAKYIVDLPKEYISGSSLFGKILSIPIQINGGKNYNIPTSIKITPYTEPDRKQIENEVWDFVSRLVWSFGDREILGMDIALAVRDMTYQEAKAKYEAWMADKKQKETSELEEVTALANRIGIHRLYSLVNEIRGE